MARRRKEWTPRKKGFAIGRIYHLTLGAGEKFYLSTLLNFVKGATCYEDIRVVHGVVYRTFKEACYARGLLDYDNITIRYLCNLFYMLLSLSSCTLWKPENIWRKTWIFFQVIFYTDNALFNKTNVIDHFQHPAFIMKHFNSFTPFKPVQLENIFWYVRLHLNDEQLQKYA